MADKNLCDTCIREKNCEIKPIAGVYEKCNYYQKENKRIVEIDIYGEDV